MILRIVVKDVRGNYKEIGMPYADLNKSGSWSPRGWLFFVS
jgi:hypothetical protein